MNKQVLVTGINGFVGHHVAVQLHQRECEVVGVGSQTQLQDDLKGIANSYIGCDLTDSYSVKKIDLKNVDVIINLAGCTNVGDSKDKGELYNRVNVGVNTVLYDECLRQNIHPRIISVSTGTVYDATQTLPITEESRLVDDNNTNEYVISKKLMEVAVGDYSSRDLRCIIARPFNHTGPGQLPGFLLPDLCEQIIRSRETKAPLKVGNLETRRDFTDVRDVAKAYVDLALCDEANLEHGTYNICSGKSISGNEILNMLASALGVPEISTETDPTKIRVNEVMDIFGSHQRLTEATGWQPKITITQTIDDFIAWKNYLS